MYDSHRRSNVAEAAGRPGFNLGTIAVQPATRTVEGPAGRIAIEPRIMQVFLELADGGGNVIARETLLKHCWNGMIVGDDALNRAIFQLRRALDAVGADVSIETIPKTGYRLAGLASPSPACPRDPSGASILHPSRRALVGGLAGVAAVGGAMLFWRQPSGRSTRAALLVERGDMVRRDDMPDATEQGIGFYRAALELTPDDAAIWGRLALALTATAEYAAPKTTEEVVRSAEMAARRALDLRPDQPDARVALAMLSPHFGAWFPLEQMLRGILAAFPDNLAAQANLALVLMEVGRIGAAGAIIDRLVEREPLSPDFQHRRIYQLWARGRLPEADQVADRSLQLWPRHPAIWLARFWTFALTGRAPAAVAMADDADGPPALSPPLLDILRLSGKALATRAAGDIKAAIDANVAGARNGQFGVVSSMLTLPQLGAESVAYDVVRGYLRRDGPLVGALRRPLNQPAINQQNRRKTMPLWMPSAAPLRADARFLPLCASIGMADYWRRSGHRPDFLSGPSAG